MNLEIPSQNNIEKHASNSYEKILDDLEKILNDPEQTKSFIERRLTELKEQCVKGEIGIASRSWHTGFISPDSPIRRSYMVDPFCMDDDSVYNEMISVIQQFKDHSGWKEKSLRAMMPYIIQHTIANYFGNIASYTNTDQKNQLFYMEHDDPNVQNISISELKGKRIAVCAEKSALSQNLASFLGLETNLIISDSCKSNPDDKAGLHAYNIWKTKNGYFIYDPTNPSLKLGKETHEIIDYNPAIYPITPEQFSEIKDGGIVTVKHIDQIADLEQNSIESKPSGRIYGGLKK